MHQIFILDAFHPAGVSLAHTYASVTNWSDPNVHNWISEADAVMVRMTPITRELMTKAKKLKIICKQGVGLDTIDLDAANIGTRVAQKWRGAFNANLIAYDPFAPKDAWPLIDHVRVEYINDIISRVDLLTLHLPLTPESHHLISLKELQMMKKDAVLINVSRGGIIDESALCQVLTQGHLFGVGLDVFEIEPLRSDNPLLAFENVIFTPHASAGTMQTQERSAIQVAQKVIDALDGRETSDRVV